MVEDAADLQTRMRHLVEGYRISQAIHVAVTLGVVDLLAGRVLASEELAARTKTQPDSLYRLLRALASVEILRELEGRRFELTALGELLGSDRPDSLAGWAAYIGRPYYWQAWGELLHSIRTGENAFRHVHGTDVWTYRSSRPEESAVFDRAMASLTRRLTTALVSAYDFGWFRTVVDVGGGNGALLAGILSAYPKVQGVLFDQAHVASGAPAVLSQAGVAERCRVVPGSFFEAVPDDGDAYLLKHVIHDWEDDDAVRILTTVRRSVPADSLLLVVERLLGAPNEGQDAKFSDLNMLVAPGGLERTREEFSALLRSGGFQLARVIPAGGNWILEAKPV